MINEPIISVIMPVYNAEKYLDESIQSILNQTFNNFEFIIINDGSTDKSFEIIEKYKNQEERIILINRENKGLIASLNEGIKLSKGKYIARMDADDISLPERFRKQLDIIERNNADICGSHYFIINDKSNFIDASIVPIHQTDFLIYLAITTPFAHPSVLIRKDFLIENNIFYGETEFKYAEDYALWIFLWNKKAKFVNVNDFLISYRTFDSSLSKKNKEKIRQDKTKISKTFIVENKKELLKSFSTIDIKSKSPREQKIIALILFILIKYCFRLSFFKFFKQIPIRYVIFSFLVFIKERY